MGGLMGGLRATSVIAGNLYRNGRGQDFRAIGNVNKISTLSTLAYSTALIPIFLTSGNWVQSFSHHLGQGQGLTDAEAHQVQKYFNGFVWGAPATLLLYNDAQFSLGVGDTYLPLLYQGVVYPVLAILLARPLALGEWGSPYQLGVEGIGHAMSIGATAAWVLMRTHYLFSERYKPYELFNFKGVKGFGRYWKFCGPWALQNAVSLFSGFFTSELLTGLNQNVAAAYSGTSAYFTQLEVALLGYSSSIAALVANHNTPTLTEEDRLLKQKNLKTLSYAGMVTVLGATTILTVPYLIWQDPFIAYFAGEGLPPEASKLAHTYIWFNFVDSLVDSYGTAVEATLHGVKDITIPSLISLSETGLSLLVTWLAAEYAGESGTAIIAASIAADVYSAAALSTRWWQVARSLRERVANVVRNPVGGARRLWGYVTNLFVRDEGNLRVDFS